MKRITLLLIIFLLLGLNSRIVDQEFQANPKGQFLIKSNTVPRISTHKVTKTYTFTQHEPISISSNGDFISQGFPGSGTLDDPFLIEGYDITASSGTLIEISGTSAYFLLANNILNGMNTDGQGIFCSSVMNGEFKNNTVYNNVYGGIELYNSINNIIENNTVYNNNGDGINMGGENNNNIFLNNTVYDNAGAGFRLGNVMNGRIDNNTIINNANEGILLDHSNSNIFTQNTISNNRGGIGIDSNSKSNSVFNNTITSNNEDGIFLFGTNNAIINNTISDNTESGIRSERGSNNNIFNNLIINNEVYGITLYSSSNNNSIAKNEISYHSENGIQLGENSNHNTLANNTIHNNRQGIFIGLNGGSVNNTIVTNIIYNNGGNGLSLEMTTYSTITYNSFANNFDYGISLDSQSANNLVALNNFTNNLRGEAYDDGTSNQFTHNFWNFWTSPDANDDDIVDNPYMIDGSASNNDPSPLVSSDKLKTMHVFTIPRILRPEGIEFQDVITIQWIAPFDSFNHNFNYSVYYSSDSGDSWILLASNQTETSYIWDTSNIPQDSVVILKVVASCSGGIATEAISDPYSLTPSLNWANLIVALLFIGIILIAVIGSVIFWKKGYIFRKPPVPIETFTPTMDRKEIAPSTPKAPATPMIPVTIDSESLQDLLIGRAISIDVLTAEFNCSQLELPHRVKDVIGESMKERLLVMRAGLFLIENCPPTKANCQICAREFEGENYFQCEHCQRYVCTPHYVDMKIVGSPDCPNCGGTLISLPFSCEGCGLDFSNVAELPGEATTRCPLCGYSLVTQTDLIEKRTSTIIPSTQIKPFTEEFDEKKKKK